jgi:DNA-binding NarL/FixJ family response regulator
VNPTASPLHILLVDDHPLVRTGLRTALRAHFPTALIEEAGCAAEANVILAARPPRLVLLDVNLPSTSGVDFARQLRSRNRNVQVLTTKSISAFVHLGSYNTAATNLRTWMHEAKTTPKEND